MRFVRLFLTFLMFGGWFRATLQRGCTQEFPSIQMLLSFTIENFRSFADATTLTFRAEKDDTNQGSLLTHGKESWLPVIGVFGANASGKSNLLKAIDQARRLIVFGAVRTAPGGQIAAAQPFRLDAKLRAAPTVYAFQVRIADKVYDYQFAVLPTHVVAESMRVKSDGSRRRLTLFTRQVKEVERAAEWRFGDIGASGKSLLKEHTRPNVLALTRAADFNVAKLQEIYDWFRKALWPLDPMKHSQWFHVQTAKRAWTRAERLAQLRKLVVDADIGISGLELREVPENVSDDVQSLRAGIQRFREEIGRRPSSPPVKVFTHRRDAGGELIEFDFVADESLGTQRLFQLAGPVLDALETGSAVIVDELDSSLHPNLMKKLVALFSDRRSNPGGAQLLFTTHDVALLDSGLLRRDQVWFTEKNSAGRSELYSLYDFGKGDDKPRKDESYLRRYLQGRYGAVPNFGPSLEDLDLNVR